MTSSSTFPAPDGFKQCPSCKVSQPLEDFPRNRAFKNGRATYCKPRHNRIMRENRIKHHGSCRNYWLKRRYGIDNVTASWLVLQQNDQCALCGHGKPKHVDHNHTTGTVRGILCFNCNRGIAKFDEDAETMTRALQYLGPALR